MELLILSWLEGTFLAKTNLNSNMELLISQILTDGTSILNSFKFQYGATNILIEKE